MTINQSWSRRGFLRLSGAAGLASTGLLSAHAATILPHERFSFLFVTDTHLQPELDAAGGCHACFRKAHSIGGDFAIQGGDHVFDALGVAQPRADNLISLYTRTEQDLGMKIHHTIGNHDCFGVYTKSGVQPTDPLYGKKFFEDHFGRLYYAFDHRGVHFIVLDSIGLTEDRDYEGRIDTAQLAWLASDLAALPAGTPTIVVSHIPLVTAFDSYAAPLPVPARHHKNSVINGWQVIDLLSGHNVLGVLQGHVHINETILWRGIPYITGGAVSGNWWHGTHLGTPEGFTVVTVEDNRLVTRYETYGFKSVDPHNT
ncbi:metallophosphoesterase family protein [Lichenicola cladoniae]|uniref:metallophosphoesterase family protein n=1 Tax=Lichenicola cladoniae TaxID=1484109 RepID=UPI001EF49BAC|nr:metallophosphoesterase [Lichenicola cladoniae]